MLILIATVFAGCASRVPGATSNDAAIDSEGGVDRVVSTPDAQVRGEELDAAADVADAAASAANQAPEEMPSSEESPAAVDGSVPTTSPASGNPAGSDPSKPDASAPAPSEPKPEMPSDPKPSDPTPSDPAPTCVTDDACEAPGHMCETTIEEAAGEDVRHMSLHGHDDTDLLTTFFFRPRAATITLEVSSSAWISAAHFACSTQIDTCEGGVIVPGANVCQFLRFDRPVTVGCSGSTTGKLVVTVSQPPTADVCEYDARVTWK
jgi:hypothetical protein